MKKKRISGGTEGTCIHSLLEYHELMDIWRESIAWIGFCNYNIVCLAGFKFSLVRTSACQADGLKFKAQQTHQINEYKEGKFEKNQHSNFGHFDSSLESAQKSIKKVRCKKWNIQKLKVNFWYYCLYLLE